MSTVPTTAAPDGRQAAISDAARRLYDAEVALHIARQTGVAAWISAAYDRLHEAITGHTAALGSAGTAVPPQLRPRPAQPEIRTAHAARPAAA
jgi:hypothetical protein